MPRIGSRLAGYNNELTSMALSANYAFTTSFTDVTGPWQIVVPANSGPLQIGIPEVLISITTGATAAVGTSYNAQVRVLDEANAVVAFTELKIYNSATAAQIWASNLPVLGRVANNTSQKTYRVQAGMSNAGTLSAAAAINTAAVIGTDPVLRALRL